MKILIKSCAETFAKEYRESYEGKIFTIKDTKFVIETNLEEGGFTIFMETEIFLSGSKNVIVKNHLRCV